MTRQLSGQFAVGTTQASARGIPGAGLCDRQALAAKGTVLGLIGDYVERCQRHARNAYFRLSTTAIDNRAGRYRARAGRLEDVDHFASAAAGGDYVFHDYSCFARLQGESAPKDHLARSCIAFGE